MISEKAYSLLAFLKEECSYFETKAGDVTYEGFVRQTFTCGGLCIAVMAGAENGNEDLSPKDLVEPLTY